MIGVVADPAHHDAVREFFELFKTPWEWVIPDKRYRIILSSTTHAGPFNADLALVYGSYQHSFDRTFGMEAEHTDGPVDLKWHETVVPVYGRVATFHGLHAVGLLCANGRCAAYRASIGSTTLQRVGYDLFGEVFHLLSQGQPRAYALVPTLERHIALIRHYLDEGRIPYVEVPPRPDGAEFVCCLTHDIDFFGIRRHVADRTLGGFALRATLGTVRDAALGRRPLGEAMRNWLAAISLPLVLLGIKRDFWDPFRDYALADRGHKSTFFLVPFKRRAGISPAGTINRTRAVPYGVSDLRLEVQQLDQRQVEVAVHGIDTWRDADAGRNEKAELEAVSPQARTGVRMHWLYFSSESPRHIEAAGFDYDSSWGYNDAIGFRAGTLQVFRFPGSDDLLELPLSIMDTAMFFPDRMGLSREQSRAHCLEVIDHARRFGGALVINWHDRSLVPERQWHSSYDDLLDTVEAAGAWFTTGGEAVDWFRWRRSIRFTEDEDGASRRIVVDAPPVPDGLPPARLVARREVDEQRSFAGGRAFLQC